MLNRLVWCALLGVALSTGCVSGKSAGLAKSGDRTALKAVLAEKQKTGTLSNSEARAIAEAVVRRELRAEAREERKKRVAEVSACARDIDDELRRIAKTHDDIGAVAADILLDTGIERSIAASATETESGWRAIWARSLTGSGDGETRRSALVDADARVRRGALRASMDAHDLNDAGLILERAQVDPDLQVRSLAVRALISTNGTAVARQLRDLYASGDTALKVMVATAWGTTLRTVGGDEQLRALMTNPHADVEPMAMAGVLYLRAPSPTGDLKELGNAAVARALTQGTQDQKRTMLRLAPLSAELLPLVKDAAKGTDREMSVAAWGRLLSLKDEHAAAKEGLRRYAGNDLGRISSSARELLAMDGDKQIQAWIERDLESPDVLANLYAVRALAAIGRVARAAPLLVSESASVRNRVACAMLAASR